jgi:hypothetical protein
VDATGQMPFPSILYCGAFVSFFFGKCKNIEPSVGDQLRRLEDKGVVIRFVVGRRYGLVLSRR